MRGNERRSRTVAIDWRPVSYWDHADLGGRCPGLVRKEGWQDSPLTQRLLQRLQQTPAFE
jgi:hypothetical protein